METTPETTLERLKEHAGRKLRRHLQKEPVIRESQAYARFAYGLRKEDFHLVVLSLHEQCVLELCDGKQARSAFLVRKDKVEDYLKSLYQE